MIPLILHHEAESELLEAAVYFDKQCPGLGAAFLAEFDTVTGKIRQSPRAFAPFPAPGHDDTRKAILKRFPYLLPFVEWKGAVWILAVAHQKRRPVYWAARRVEKKVKRGAPKVKVPRG